MKIKPSLPSTKMLAEAKNSRSHNAVIEIIIFIAVFAVGAILQVIAVAVPELSYLFNSPEYIQIMQDAASGVCTDTAEITKRVMDVLPNLPNYIMIISLFATVMSTMTVMIYCKVFEKRKLSTLGFKKNNALLEYLAGMLVGTGIFSAAVGICLVTGALEYKGMYENIAWSYVGLYFLGFLLQGMSEEVIFRGYLTVSLSRRVPVAVAVGISSVIFACAHLGNSGISVLAFINLSLFGAFAAVYMLKRGNIWGVCAVHSLWNFVQGNLYGIRVSGMQNMDSILEMSSVESKVLINGGEFGLEGGLAVTVVLVIGIIVLLCTKTKKCELAESLPEDESQVDNMGEVPA